VPPPYTGGCDCGSVSYIVTAEPIRVSACHCNECKRQAGGASALSKLLKKDGLKVTGLTTQFTCIGDGGSEATWVFCPECGVHIYHALQSAPDELTLKPGALADMN
jgi:hypothetical protein